MYVKSVEFENLRCFKKGRIEFRYPGDGIKTPDGVPNLENVNLILGVNGSGKTTALKAVALAMIGQFPRQTGFVPHSLVRMEETKSPRTARTKVEILPTGDEPKKVFEFESIIHKIHSTEEVSSTIQNSSEVFFDDQTNAYFLAGYGATRYVETTDFKFASRRKEGLARYERIASIFEEQFTLIPMSVWLQQDETDNFQYVWKQMEFLNHLLPNGLRLKGINRTTQPRFWGNNNNIELRFTALPDGYRAYIGWIADLLHHIDTVCRPDKKLEDLQGVVMVDEIDLHVHPTWQRTIISHVAQALPNLQFIFTTHSPIVAGSVSSQNLWVTRTLEDGSCILERPDTEIYGLNADQILTSSVFGLESTRAQGFLDELEGLRQKAVEGDTEAAMQLMRGMAQGKAAFEEPEVPDWVKEIAEEQKSKAL